MATRAFPMSNSLSPVKRKSAFTRRLFALLLFVLGISFWTYLISQNQRFVSKDLMMVLATIMISLAAGLGARFIFYGRNWFVRLFTSWAALILGLFLLGYLTNWKMGFGPISFWRSTWDWLEIAQVAGGMIIVIIALTAWWHGPAVQTVPRKAGKPGRKRGPSKKRVEHAVEQRPRERPVEHPPERERPRPVERPREQPRPLSISVSARPAAKKPGLFNFPTRRVQPKKERPLHVNVTRQARAIARSRPKAEKVVIGRLTKKGRSNRLMKLFQGTPELQISTHEEHRCPFCLEDVKPNDPRGVKECSICHTLHHADCWDITGMCQVPHLNS